MLQRWVVRIVIDDHHPFIALPELCDQGAAFAAEPAHDDVVVAQEPEEGQLKAIEEEDGEDLQRCACGDLSCCPVTASTFTSDFRQRLSARFA